MKWTRVTRKVLCPICKHADWCCIGEQFVNCMRVQSEKACANGGWLHALDGAPQIPAPRYEPPKPLLQVSALIDPWRIDTNPVWINRFATDLGVSPLSLLSLGCCWSRRYRAWAWPMRNGYGEPIGIRLRSSDGHKFAVTGSRAGLFIPVEKFGPDLLIAEGPTDTAAGLTIGMQTIGRPSCLGSEGQVDQFVRRNGIRKVIICADSDTPGQNGAKKLQESINVPSVIFTPPKKDLRAAVVAGLTKDMIISTVKDLLWTTAT